MQRFVCFLFEELVWKCSGGSEAFPGACESTKAFCLPNIPVFYWFSSLPSSSAGKERRESGETSEPKWGVYSCGWTHSNPKRSSVCVSQSESALQPCLKDFLRVFRLLTASDGLSCCVTPLLVASCLSVCVCVEVGGGGWAGLSGVCRNGKNLV